MERRVSPSTSRGLIASRCWWVVSFGLRPNLTPFWPSRLRGLARALLDAAIFQLRGNAKDRKHDLGKVRCRIEERLDQ
jgi:hypothetical protein